MKQFSIITYVYLYKISVLTLFNFYIPLLFISSAIFSCANGNILAKFVLCA